MVIPLTNQNRALQLMYQALDYFKGGSGGNGGTVQGGGSNLQDVVARQDAQLTLMQKQIELLTKLLFKDQSIDPSEFESGISKKQAKRYKNQNFMAGTVVTG
jgi:4-diphosphocytidyl-2C-methyl-D-erythritol kinase